MINGQFLFVTGGRRQVTATCSLYYPVNRENYREEQAILGNSKASSVMVIPHGIQLPQVDRSVECKSGQKCVMYSTVCISRGVDN